jgi:hypothetical protein
MKEETKEFLSGIVVLAFIGFGIWLYFIDDDVVKVDNNKTIYTNIKNNISTKKEPIAIEKDTYNPIPKKIILGIKHTLENDYHMTIKSGNLCSEDGEACEIRADEGDKDIVDEVQIAVTHKSIDVFTNTTVDPQYYQNICSGVLSSVSGIGSRYSQSIINDYFVYASTNGSTTWELNNVELTITPDSSSILECSFYISKIR